MAFDISGGLDREGLTEISVQRDGLIREGGLIERRAK